MAIHDFYLWRVSKAFSELTVAFAFGTDNPGGPCVSLLSLPWLHDNSSLEREGLYAAKRVSELVLCSRVLALLVQTSWAGLSWLGWTTQGQFGGFGVFYQPSNVSCRASCAPLPLFPFFLFLIAIFYTKPTYLSNKHPEKSGQHPVFIHYFGRGPYSWLLKK